MHKDEIYVILVAICLAILRAISNRQCNIQTIWWRFHFPPRNHSGFKTAQIEIALRSIFFH